MLLNLGSPIIVSRRIPLFEKTYKISQGESFSFLPPSQQVKIVNTQIHAKQIRVKMGALVKQTFLADSLVNVLSGIKESGVN